MRCKWEPFILKAVSIKIVKLIKVIRALFSLRSGMGVEKQRINAAVNMVYMYIY